MAPRRKIGLIYKYDENWIGGTYYIQNLISSLNTLPDKEKPELVVIADAQKDFDSLVVNTGYPYLQLSLFSAAYPLYKRAANRLFTMLSGRPLFGLFSKDIELVFPAWVMRPLLYCPELLYWIPDFQEKHLPRFFSGDELKKRSSYQEEIVKYGKNIVFSSHAALSDFEKFYPQNKLTKHVLQFAVTHKLANADDVLAKYSITGQYFICSNQFWKHKNHAVVLNAMSILKNQGISFTVVFTGKEHDDRNPEFFPQLKKMVDELGIANEARLLGFIPRNDQLELMEQSVAVIQPSLFEGWSTVIEDAKALHVHVVASDLDVHREQLRHYEGRYFFPVEASAELASILRRLTEVPPPVIRYDYDKDVKDFGKGFVSVITDALS